MDEIYNVTPEQIAKAQAAGWTVQADDGFGWPPKWWLLLNPDGKSMVQASTKEGAWNQLDRFLAPAYETEPSALEQIIAERQRQDAKWGQQNHDAGKWSLILMEELGEVAKSQLEGDRTNYLTELVQAAAVLMAWLECELRKES